MSIEIDFIAGYCPVQSEGTIDGKPFYFRARGEHWAIGIGGSDVLMMPEWYRRRRYSDARYAAGWMLPEEAERFIRESAADYLKGNKP